jgi:hypothetical protein
LKDYSSTPFTYIDLDNWKTYQEKLLSVIYPAINDSVIDKKNQMVARLNKHRKQLLSTAFPNGAVVMLVDETRSNKFEPKYVGPYFITRRSHHGQYVLRDTSGDILDRHVPADKLKLVSRKPRACDTKDNVYEVNKILSHRGVGDNTEYQVQWKNYLHDIPTWEPASSFIDTGAITEYWKAFNAAHPPPPSSSSSHTRTTRSTNKRK